MTTVLEDFNFIAAAEYMHLSRPDLWDTRAAALDDLTDWAKRLVEFGGGVIETGGFSFTFVPYYNEFRLDHCVVTCYDSGDEFWWVVKPEVDTAEVN